MRFRGVFVLVGPSLSLLLVGLARNSRWTVSDASPRSVLARATRFVRRGHGHTRWARARTIVTTTFELAAAAPLNWYLSEKAIERLGHGPADGEFDALEAWWSERVPGVHRARSSDLPSIPIRGGRSGDAERGP